MEILRDNVPEEHVDHVQALAREYDRNEQDAVDKINGMLGCINVHMDRVLNDARADKPKELVQEYARGERDAVTFVNELLTDADRSMDSLMTEVFRDRIDEIERIDQLTAI